MNEENITTDWLDPDDAPKLDRDWFEEADLRDGDRVVRRGRPRAEHGKQAISLRLDREVLEWFRKSGAGWQTRMNEALRKAAGI